jgi:hypothetical protein
MGDVKWLSHITSDEKLAEEILAILVQILQRQTMFFNADAPASVNFLHGMHVIYAISDLSALYYNHYWNVV